MSNGKVIIVSGGKGGVGKSVVALGTADALLARGVSITLIETDDSNPDTAKTLNGADRVSIEVASIDDESGYIRAANAIERAAPSSTVVVNTPARGLASLLTNWFIIDEVAGATGREIVVLFPINRQRDSVELLREQIAGARGAPVVAILNTYFGAPEKFSLFSGSRTRNDCASVAIWPELTDVIADRMTNERKRLDLAASADGGFTIAERSTIRRYREAVATALIEAGVI
jgi:hypothetical protein